MPEHSDDWISRLSATASLIPTRNAARVVAADTERRSPSPVAGEAIRLGQPGADDLRFRPPVLTLFGQGAEVLRRPSPAMAGSLAAVAEQGSCMECGTESALVEVFPLGERPGRGSISATLMNSYG